MFSYFHVFCSCIKASDTFTELFTNEKVIYTLPISFDDIIPRRCKLDKNSQTISCPAGSNARNTAYISVATDNMPSAIFDFKEFTCNSITKNAKQYCYVDVYQNNEYINGQHPDAGQTINGTIEPIQNKTQISIYFFAGEDESVFKLPVIKFIGTVTKKKAYGQPKLTSLGNDAYRASVEISSNDEIFLQTLTLKNMFPPPTTFKSFNLNVDNSNNYLMILPMIANESLIIGYDIYNDDYFLSWEQKTDITGSFMELSMKPRRKFVVSYLIIERKSNNWRDALEKWQLTFNDIYSKNNGVGAWVPFAEEKYITDELMGTFMPKYYWGTMSLEKLKGMESYLYIEPTLLHNENIDCDELFNEKIESCNDDICQLIKDYGVRDSKNNLICQVNYNKIGSQIPTVYHGAAKEFLEKDLREYLKMINVTGVGVDSFKNIGASYYPKNLPIESVPYYCIDRYNNNIEYVNMMSLYFPLFYEMKEYSPKGFMTNADFTVPQLTKYIASSGYEFYVPSLRKDEVSTQFWTHRFTLGSRAMSYLDISGSYSFVEEYFSYCSVLGCTPSFFESSRTKNFWESKDYQDKMKPFYDKWRPILQEILTDAIFYANGDGKVKGFDNDNWAVYCKKDKTCYASFYLLNENVEYNATIEGNPEFFFASDGVKWEINGNVTKMSSIFPHRSLIVKFTSPENNPNPNSNSGSAGKIAGFVIAGIAIAALIAVIAWVIYDKRRKNSSKKSELDETVVV